MSKENQIEEMTNDLCDIDCKGMKCDSCDSYGCEYRMQAEALYNAGYRKQSEGEWKINSDGYYPYCPNCNTEPKNGVMSNFCPNCGANMGAREDATE